jgi:hypothetical protein
MVNRIHLLLVLFLLLVEGTSLELLDLLGNASPALLESEPAVLVLDGLGLPVLALFSGLELWVLADCSMSVSVDLLDIVRADTISEIRCELLLESISFQN